ncbi:MAG: metallophosphoesterase [Lentisphaeria bacterium]|nr:metallophosphoesterase [Lentisphaeria bacterium]
MKKIHLLFTILCCSILFTAAKGEDYCQINFAETPTYWVKNAPENWSEVIAGNAEKVQIDVVKGLNLDRIVGKSGNSRDTGVLYFEIIAEKTANALLGIGCDWYFEAAINGQTCYSTYDKGNFYDKMGFWNHTFKVPLKKGKNLLAVKVKRGVNSWFFCINNSKSDYLLDYNHPLTPVADFPEYAKRNGTSYEIILLGDVHYDGEEYHVGVDKKKLNDVPRNLWAWKNTMPRLINAAVARKTADTKAIIQVGDLVQGDCNSGSMHRKMLKDALNYFESKFGSTLFLSVIGNHDWRSIDGHKAYDKVMFPYYSKKLGKKINNRNFYFLIDQDLYIFADFARPDVKVIEEALEKNPDARYKFLVTHGSVLPTDNDKFDWYMFGRDDKFRNYMRNLFLKNDLIVLSGHSHTVEVIDCVAAEGRISQLICSSIWNPESLIKSKLLFNDGNLYGSRQSTERMQKRYAEFKGTIKNYWRVESAGYFVLKISPDGVTADYYAGDNNQIIYSYKLR